MTCVSHGLGSVILITRLEDHYSLTSKNSSSRTNIHDAHFVAVPIAHAAWHSRSGAEPYTTVRNQPYL